MLIRGDNNVNQIHYNNSVLHNKAFCLSLYSYYDFFQRKVSQNYRVHRTYVTLSYIPVGTTSIIPCTVIRQH